MVCALCGKQDCICSLVDGGPTQVRYPVGYGNNGVWDNIPPKSTTGGVKTGGDSYNESQKWDNSPPKGQTK
jgi:hypothetical protein